MTSSTLRGFHLDEIDDISKELIQTLSELGVSRNLGILGLCRTIVMLGSDEDLDFACRAIDELTDLPFDKPLDFDED